MQVRIPIPNAGNSRGGDAESVCIARQPFCQKAFQLLVGRKHHSDIGQKPLGEGELATGVLKQV